MNDLTAALDKLDELRDSGRPLNAVHAWVGLRGSGRGYALDIDSTTSHVVLVLVGDLTISGTWEQASHLVDEWRRQLDDIAEARASGKSHTGDRFAS